MYFTDVWYLSLWEAKWAKDKDDKTSKRSENIVNRTFISNGETRYKQLITCSIPAILKYERARKKFQLGRMGVIPLQRLYIDISSSIDGIPIKTAHTINFDKKSHGEYLKLS